MEPQTQQRKEILSNFFGIARFFVTVVLLVFVIQTFGFQSYEVFGQSMQPTLEQGDRLLISKFGKTFSRVTGDPYIPERGEVVVFHDPRNEDIQLIKRVIGLPGDRVVVRDGSITVYNDENPDGLSVDDLIPSDLSYTTGSVNITISENHLFVVGDNRSPGASLDSRNDLGTIDVRHVVGHLVFRIFPISEARWFQ